MLKIPTAKVWTGQLACLAIALVVAGSALAQQQNQSDQDQQQQTSNQPDRESDSDSQRDEDRDRDRDQQQRQRDQQSWQTDEQSRQRDQQDQQRTGQAQWDESRARQRSQQEWSDWPQPSRDQFGRPQQAQYDTYSERRSTQFGESRDEQDAGLGVTIISDGGPGVVVSRVFRGTPADEMGIQTRDRITHVNGQEVRSVGEFINRIRNMNPGDEVELDVMRNRDERTVRGELETREEALVLSSRQPRGQYLQQGQYGQRVGDSWQTSYEDSRGYTQSQDRYARGDFNSRLSSIEQQVNRLSRELEDLRLALRDIRQNTQDQYGRTGETQAGYDEYRAGSYQERYQPARRTAERWDPRTSRFGEFRGGSVRQEGGYQGPIRPREGERFQGETRERQFQSGTQQGEFEGSGRNRSEQRDDSPGGETGGERLRVGSDEQSNR